MLQVISSNQDSFLWRHPFIWFELTKGEKISWEYLEEHSRVDSMFYLDSVSLLLAQPLAILIMSRDLDTLLSPLSN